VDYILEVYAGGRIVSAVTLPQAPSEFEARREAATVLKELGHREVYNLAGGFDAWERAGLPFEKP